MKYLGFAVLLAAITMVLLQGFVFASSGPQCIMIQHATADGSFQEFECKQEACPVACETMHLGDFDTCSCPGMPPDTGCVGIRDYTAPPGVGELNCQGDCPAGQFCFPTDWVPSYRAPLYMRWCACQ